MKKKSWTFSCRIRCKGKALQHNKKWLKRLRSKARRRTDDPKAFEKTTNAWDVS